MRKYICVFIVMIMAMAQVDAQTLGSLNLGGCLIDSKANDYKSGVYSINADGSLAPLTLAPETWATGGGVMKDGVYYCTCLEEIWKGFYYITGFAFDGETWEQIDAYDLGTDLSFVATDLAYDATTGNIYGCFYDGTFDGYEFGTIEYGTEKSVRQTIAPLAVGYEAIAAATDGTLYAVDYNGNLVKVNKENGEGTVIGKTGLVCKYPVSATINQTTGEMFMTMLDNGVGRLYKINTATAEASLVCTFANGEEITGLFYFDATVLDKPSVVSNLTASFMENSLIGTVSFTAPTATIGGGKLAGEIEYTITANGEIVATGVTASGATVEENVELPESGDYEIAVFLSNAAGNGKSVSTSLFVGDDVPDAVQDLNLLYVDGRMTLTWSAPKGVHGGYINQAKVVYNVARVVNGEAVAVATGITDNFFSENFPEPETMAAVKYNVTAVYLGKESVEASSNAILVGPVDIHLPYIEDFEKEAILDMFTIIDANDDGKTWDIAEVEGNHVARIAYNDSKAMDDWLITAPIKLEAGKTYTVSFKASGNSPSFHEHVEAFFANGAAIEALKSGFVVAKKTELANRFVTFTKTFVPTETGNYYLGIHGCSEADRYYLDVDDISITEGAHEIAVNTAPWSEDFESDEAFDAFTVIDANEDGIFWDSCNTDGEHGTVARISYNEQKAMDDWLITAPIRLENGYAYSISFKAACYGRNFPERLEAFVATDATAEAMNDGVRLIEPVVLESEEFVTISNTFIPEKTGDYYIGIHGMSDADMFHISIDDIAVAEGISTATPGGADVTVESDATGALKAVLHIKAPTTTQAGNELAAIDKIEIERDGEVIGTLTSVVPGGEYTFADDGITKNGMNEWTVTAFNAEGTGKSVHATAYIGLDVPAVVRNINVEEVSDGKVRISWTAPTVDVNGKPLASGITYKIIDANYMTVVEGIEATEYVCDAVEDGEQDFVYYYIGASNDIGFGDFDQSDMILVGTPYAYPYEESFTDGGITSIFGFENPDGSNADWELYDEEKAGIPDADGTNGFIGMYGYAYGEQSSLFTGKISLVGAENPALSFFYNGLTADNMNTLEVAVREFGTSDWTVLTNFVQDGATEDYEWIKVVLPLDKFKGKIIQLQWTPTRVNYPFGLIDGIRVGEAISHDLSARIITAPARVNANNEFNVNVTIANNGTEEAEGYTVELYRDGEKVQEHVGEALAPGARMEIAFKETLGVTADEAVYSAVVVYGVDEDNENNATESVKVVVKMPTVPTVSDLAASPEGNGVKLTWSAPNLTNLPKAAVTEDFEDAVPLSQAIADWMFIDMDGANIGGIQDIYLPFKKASWFVIDSSDPAFGKTFASNSGTKHLSTMFNYNGEKNDDWLLSPALCGDAQTISLWARSYIVDYGMEKMELLYSVTDNNPSSFVSVKEVSVPAVWTEYTFDVPSGAKYFAIRCTSKNVYMLFVDDVTYIPSGASQQNLIIKGYNIYRDGVKMNDAPVSATSFIDSESADGVHSYIVTVVYEQAESAPSYVATVEVSGIYDIHADAPKANGSIYSVSGSMVRKGNKSLEGLAKGIYIVNGKKLIVK